MGLSYLDIGLFLAFFVVTIGTSLYKSRKEETGEDFFLASRGLHWPLIGISLILIFALRSLRIGLISMMPNLVPAAMGFGLWGLTVGEVGLGLSIVAGMTLGIVVDDTVHFLSKYIRARREHGLDREDAVRYAFRTVGMALFTTSIVLITGFLVLSLSSFELNSGMGLLTAIVICFALVADFFLLPPLLMKLDHKEMPKLSNTNKKENNEESTHAQTT